MLEHITDADPTHDETGMAGAALQLSKAKLFVESFIDEIAVADVKIDHIDQWSLFWNGLARFAQDFNPALHFGSAAGVDETRIIPQAFLPAIDYLSTPGQFEKAETFYFILFNEVKHFTSPKQSHELSQSKSYVIATYIVPFEHCSTPTPGALEAIERWRYCGPANEG